MSLRGVVGVLYQCCYSGPIAQWLEQRTHNPLVLGSSPSGPTILRSFWSYGWHGQFSLFQKLELREDVKLSDESTKLGQLLRP